MNFTFELLINPLLRTVRQSLKDVVNSTRKHKYVINLSGDRAYQGDLNCADGSFACDDFITILGNTTEVSDDQRKALKQPGASKLLTFLMPSRVLDANRSWKQALEKQYASVAVQAIQIGSSTSIPENLELNEALTP